MTNDTTPTTPEETARHLKQRAAQHTPQRRSDTGCKGGTFCLGSMGIRILDDLTSMTHPTASGYIFLALTTWLRSRVHCSNQPTKSDRPAYRTGLVGGTYRSNISQK